MSVAVSIRLGDAGDVASVALVERAADAIFPRGALPGDEITAAATIEHARAEGSFLVAESAGVVVGFAVAEPHGDAMHLEQLSVHPDAGRRGIGAALLEAVADDALAAGFGCVTLTTFRSFAWNAPFYLRRGFVEPAVLPAHLIEALADETRMGFDPTDRVGLVRGLG